MTVFDELRGRQAGREASEVRFKLAINDMLYEARMLPAGQYRKLIQIAERVGIQWTGNPLDYARAPYWEE